MQAAAASAGAPGVAASGQATSTTAYAAVEQIYEGPEAIATLHARLLATTGDVKALKALLPAAVLIQLLAKAAALTKAEPTLVEVRTLHSATLLPACQSNQLV